MSVSLNEVNGMDRVAFVDTLGGVFEHSPWIADAAWERGPFATVDDLWQAMTDIAENASEDARLALIRAHPDLAGKAARAGALTEPSTREQAGAGLDGLSEEEYARFHRLNDAYKARFGFPFIIAVRDHDKDSILAAFETRIAHAPDEEMREALRNIGLIAKYRLRDLVRP